ncbi:MAG: asparagine synthetase B [Ruminococcus sp.]|nr:asparagine synthetase B [Ruminococcus sp.]MBQ1815847.1 asparagine synthetase B [Ruminococcus sp.]
MNNQANNIELRYFSGYIRNRKKLCAELNVSYQQSRQACEEQVLVRAYLQWGLEMTSHIFGMFAFAIWDGNAQKLFVVRDQVGQKQMFYAVVGSDLIYSGDINEIAADPRLDKQLNKRMLQQYLFYGYPIGKETFYEGVFKLLPGHYLEWDGKTAAVRRYWKPEFKPENTKTADEWAAEIVSTVDEILDEERGDAEVPYKESFLSGGVDSSYLFAASDAQCANTVGYAESGFDESALARHTAEVLNKAFRVKQIAPGEFFERIPTVIEKLGQPLGDASAVAFSLGCKAVKEYADVVYSGEGIDEFFGGYNAHKRPLGEGWTYLTCSHIMSEEVVRSVLSGYDEKVKIADPVTEIWNETAGQDELSRKLTIDVSLWLEGDIYLNTDRTSTACGIELHTPFSDLRLFELAARIPGEFKFVGDQNKYVFRKAAASKLPDEVAFRKKVGFAVPIRKWLADESYNKPIAEVLFGEASQKFFNQSTLKEWWESYLGGEEFLWSRIYAIYAFLLWYKANM